jgi:hypothetical protein
VKHVLRTIFLSTWIALLADSRVVADELKNLDWAKFQIDPEPSSQQTLREKLDAHLFRVDRSLAHLRSGCRQTKTAMTDYGSRFSQCRERLQGAYQFVSTSQNDPKLASHVGSVDELVRHLKQAEQIATSIHQGKELTSEMFQTLQAARGFVKMVRRQLPEPDLAASEDRSDGSSTGSATPLPRCNPAMIIDPAVGSPPARTYLAFPIRNALWQLSVQTLEQRKQYVRRIVEDEGTRLLEMVSVPGATAETPSYFLLVAKEVELPDGGLRTIQFPFRLTVERVGTDGVGNKLRILADRAPDAGVVIRTKLLTEVAVTKGLSVTSYETCVTYFPAPEPEHRGKTLVTYGADMELTFYRHNTSRIRDVNYRSIAASKSKSALEKSKERGIVRACEELTSQISQALGKIAQ